MKLSWDKELYKLSDEDVAVLAKKNPDAANHLVARYRNYVYKCAASFYVLGAEQDDIVQEGMIGLCNAIKRFNPDSDAKFRSFAAVCIRRQILSAVKASTRKKHIPLNSYVSLSDTDAENVAVFKSENEPLSAILDEEYFKKMSVKISKKLSKLELKVLYSYLDGLSYSQIAKQIGKSEKAVDNAICRIKKKLLFLLGKEDE